MHPSNLVNVDHFLSFYTDGQTDGHIGNLVNRRQPAFSGTGQIAVQC